MGEALAEALGSKGVAVCPAFPQAGRRVFQGHLFVGDRLLSESGMEHHPLNPMTDPDLRRWLARQSRHPVGHVAWPAVAAGADSIRAALAASAAKGEWLTVVDAIEDRDLLALGAALDGARLLTGGSGIALGLAANFAKAGRLAQQGSAFKPRQRASGGAGRQLLRRHAGTGRGLQGRPSGFRPGGRGADGRRDHRTGCAGFHARAFG